VAELTEEELHSLVHNNFERVLSRFGMEALLVKGKMSAYLGLAKAVVKKLMEIFVEKGQYSLVLTCLKDIFRR